MREKKPPPTRTMTPLIKIWEPSPHDENYTAVAERIKTLIAHQETLIDICSQHNISTAQILPASREIDGKIDVVLMLTEQISSTTAVKIQRDIEDRIGVTVSVTDSPYASLSLGIAQERMTARMLTRGRENAR